MKRMSGDERRKRILEAALDVFAAKGPGGARIKEIAALSGNSDTLIYRHFPGKDALYEACLEHLTASHPVLDDVARAMDQGDDRAVLAGIAGHMFLHMREDPRLLRLRLFEALDQLRGNGRGRASRAGQRKSSVEHGLADYLAARTRSGGLAVDDPARAAKLFLYWVYMALMDREIGVTARPLRPDRALAEQLADLFLNGLRPRGA